MKPLPRLYHIYISCLALVGFTLIMLISFQYGIGVSSDGVRNLSTADNIAKGNGFIDMTGGAFTWWPPLYPLVLAVLSFFVSGDVFTAASWLNILLFVLNIYLWGVLFFRAFKDKWVYAFLSGLILVGSRSSLRLYANVFSEPLFITFTLFFMFFAAHYLQNKNRSSLWWMFFLGGLAALQRYIGVALIALAGMIALLNTAPKKWGEIVAATFLSAFPLLLWVYFHNYLQHGLLFGPRSPETMLPLQNINLMLTKSLNWFMPLHPLLKPLMLKPWLILAPMLAILIVFNKKDNWINWLHLFTKNPYVGSIVLFSLLHTLILTFTVNTVDHVDLTSDRYYVTTMPVLLIFIFLSFDALILSHFSPKGIAVRWVFPALFAIWFIFPVFSMQEYIRAGIVLGEPSNYNIYNKSFANEMPILDVARKIIVEHPAINFYSNYTSSGWFHLRRPIFLPPRQNIDMAEADLVQKLKQEYAGWPAEGEAYLIWFTPNEFLHYVPPQRLKLIANLELVYEGKDGQIYYVQPLSYP